MHGRISAEAGAVNDAGEARCVINAREAIQYVSCESLLNLWKCRKGRNQRKSMACRLVSRYFKSRLWCLLAEVDLYVCLLSYRYLVFEFLVISAGVGGRQQNMQMLLKTRKHPSRYCCVMVGHLELCCRGGLMNTFGTCFVLRKI